MQIRPLTVLDAYRVTPDKIVDERGCFYETLRYDTLLEQTGHDFTPRQVNHSVSRANTVRGIHGVRLPAGQAKFVSCVRGAVADIVVDIRPGSPTFGRHHVNRLSAENGVSVYVAEGLGHGFVALTDEACVQYLCSTTFVPGTPLEIDPMDPALDLPWPLAGPPLMSAKDAGAPTLAEAADRGLLAGYDECLRHYAANRRRRPEPARG
ncbi:dTDP-4-dehydrorhamnose 3,5-epimerase [Amorphoplanes nipponensis]|uniref:dTDP-4-dehydrorhamnose 3,5-epimerase n=1 Tax=Actinoplanes nipponensis TaxID=135950 RepID=A0A919JDU4_9ACTN|nr:dTDP-4-dehydrorhamnose 3,5-epimerase [Actinoplanes nipponensis]GIE47371.1 dTDP-4-dehydrorhamnose 3,5-epimerase [Actinoplanes nipponensis]